MLHRHTLSGLIELQTLPCAVFWQVFADSLHRYCVRVSALNHCGLTILLSASHASSSLYGCLFCLVTGWQPSQCWLLTLLLPACRYVFWTLGGHVVRFPLLCPPLCDILDLAGLLVNMHVNVEGKRSKLQGSEISPNLNPKP